MELSIGELLISGVKLMLIGMGIVYTFLAVLVWVIGITSKLIQRYSPEPATITPPVAGVEAEDNAELVAVISAAIHQYQNK